MSSAVPTPAPEEALTPAPPYTLFDAGSVGVSTFLGTPIAGSILMAINYRRLGKGASAITAIVAGLVATALALLLGNLIPPSLSIGVAVGLFLGMKAAAKALQGADVARHLSQGGKLGSLWAAFGLGLFFLGILLGGVVVGYFALNPKVKIGANDEVYYSGTATRDDALKVGAALKTMGFLSDVGASVFVSKGGKQGTVVSFVVKEGTWDSPKTVDVFEEIGRQLAPTVGGFPLLVRLMNTNRDVKKEMTVGKAIIGTKDEVYYLGSATLADAKALGAALKTGGYFIDSGFTVLLAKNDSTVVSFVVKDGFWDDAGNVAGFEKITRDLAASIGGPPITMRLLNNSLESKKEVVVQ